jgi:mono/diheme cytochrome c family protein
MDARSIGALAGLAGLALAATPPAAEPYAYTVLDAEAIPAPLGGLVGNPARGETAAARSCAGCHPGGALEGRTPGALRLAIVNLAVTGAAVADHAFYEPDAEGRVLLSARTIEDIVAHLAPMPARPEP